MFCKYTFSLLILLLAFLSSCSKGAGVLSDNTNSTTIILTTTTSTSNNYSYSDFYTGTVALVVSSGGGTTSNIRPDLFVKITPLKSASSTNIVALSYSTTNTDLSSALNTVYTTVTDIKANSTTPCGNNFCINLSTLKIYQLNNSILDLTNFAPQLFDATGLSKSLGAGSAINTITTALQTTSSTQAIIYERSDKNEYLSFNGKNIINCIFINSTSTASSYPIQNQTFNIYGLLQSFSYTTTTSTSTIINSFDTNNLILTSLEFSSGSALTTSSTSIFNLTSSATNNQNFNTCKNKFNNLPALDITTFPALSQQNTINLNTAANSYAITPLNIINQIGQNTLNRIIAKPPR